MRKSSINGLFSSKPGLITRGDPKPPSKNEVLIPEHSVSAVLHGYKWKVQVYSWWNFHTYRVLQKNSHPQETP